MSRQPKPLPKLRDGEPLIYESYKEMPYAPVSFAYTTWNHTGSWRYLRPKYIEQIPACLAACPTSNDIEKWIRFLEEGEAGKAWEVATLENPFPAIMGRVCFHPCMSGCNRKELGGAVNVNMLERFLADCNAEAKAPKPHFESNGKKVAVVGSGPAGLSSAYHLARFGYKITIFEKMPRAGGLLRYGIPEYRLPNEIIDKEISRLEEMGIEFKCNHAIKDAAELQSLKQTYDTILYATGAQKRRPLGLQGEAKDASIVPALDFLAAVAGGKKPRVGKKVLVIGGGNTACDAARVAKRLGADVTIVYRRSKEEMPAFGDEVIQAEEEGVNIEVLAAPVKVVSKGKQLIGLECQKMELGEPDDSGRRRPISVAGTNFTMDADQVLTAIGEEIDSSLIPSALKVQNGSLVTTKGGRTEWKDLFAVGDLIDQPRTVVDALASGKASAIAIDCQFRDIPFEKMTDTIKVPGTDYLRVGRYVDFLKDKKASGDVEIKENIVEFSQLNLAYFKENKPNEYPTIDLEQRTHGFDEINLKPDETVIKEEMGRCFHCGRCIDCDNCFIYCPDVSLSKKTSGYDVNFDFCKGCGVCVQECPRAAMEMVEEPVDI